MDIVTALLAARLERRPIERPGSVIPGFSLAAAYRTAAALERELESLGWRKLGRKLGFTNPATWREFDLDTPVWSAIYDRTVHELARPDASFPLATCLAPRIEPEIVVGLGDVAEHTDLGTAIEWVAAGFEIVDCHFIGGWEFSAADIVADFGAHAALIVGPKVPVVGNARTHIAAALANVEVELRCNGTVVDRGSGRNALGGPIAALEHLRRTLADQPWAKPLGAGEIITTGTLTSIPYVAPGERWSARFSGAGLGELELTFTA